MMWKGSTGTFSAELRAADAVATTTYGDGMSTLTGPNPALCG
jgi:hypothetical protein